MTRARNLSRLANSNVLAVDISNNVGIGSTIPDAKLDVIGIVSATSFSGNLTGDATGLTGSPNITINNLVGVAATFSGAADFNGAIDVDGHTELDDVNVSGAITATTFTGNLTGTAGGLSGSPNITINNLVGVAATFSGSVKIGGTAEANEIDEYEEGTWTPTFEGSTSGSGTLTNYGAWYTRIGRAVHFYCYIVCTGLGTISGNIKVAGLPFTVHATGGYQAVNFAAVEGLAITAGESLAGYCEINDDAFTLQLWDVTTGTSNLTSAELSADGGFVASGTYFA